MINNTNKVKIILNEFEEPRNLSINQIKHWFPSHRFDKRTPWEFVKKWININQNYLEFLGVKYKWDNDKGLIFLTLNKIGLIPIKNPYTGRTYGSLIIKPRIGWINISKILDSIEWKLRPDFLATEEPIMSNGVFPRWLKAIDTLKAIEKALKFSLRGTKVIEEVKDTPIGRVNWNEYSTKSFPYSKLNKFKCYLLSH